LVERVFLKWLTAASAKAPGLTDADVRTLVLAQKEANPSVGVDKIVQAIQANDPLFARERIRAIARELGIQGRRGRPKKNSAE
jgi:hypothetical protein